MCTVDRSESPCRSDYPPDLKRFLKQPMEPVQFYNSIFAPNLPYDQRICEDMCATKYWLPKCGCMMSPEVWQYAGLPENVTSCAYYNSTHVTCSTMFAFHSTPPDEYSKCECYKSCTGYSFTVSGYDKMHHAIGG